MISKGLSLFLLPLLMSIQARAVLRNIHADTITNNTSQTNPSLKIPAALATAGMAAIFDGTSTLSSSSTTSAQLAFLNTVSSNVQTQLNSKTTGLTFITSGITYTTPATITSATNFKFTAIGGGGGGGGFAATGSSSSGGGGGGGGILFINGLTPSTSYTIAIGSAGSGGIATTPGAAGNGGNTTLTIGATTYTAAGGIGSPGGSTNVNGGAGGTATNFTINITGQQGDGASNNSATALGTGGNAPFGFGLGGSSQGSANVGKTATGYGGGGGGAHGPSLAGGPGTAGMILVEYND